jgi:hypothetical protein
MALAWTCIGRLGLVRLGVSSASEQHVQITEKTKTSAPFHSGKYEKRHGIGERRTFSAL